MRSTCLQILLYPESSYVHNLSENDVGGCGTSSLLLLFFFVLVKALREAKISKSQTWCKQAE